MFNHSDEDDESYDSEDKEDNFDLSALFEEGLSIRPLYRKMKMKQELSSDFIWIVIKN